MKKLNVFHIVGLVYVGSSTIALLPPANIGLLTFCLVCAGFCILLGEAARWGTK